MAGEFDKDFGYLMPFLDKIGAAANSLSNPAARDELRQLIAGEKGRWMRIRELLANPASAAVASTVNKPSGQAPSPSPEPNAPPQFTVGSLKGRGAGGTRAQ